MNALTDTAELARDPNDINGEMLATDRKPSLRRTTAMNTHPTSHEEYRILNRALKALRENVMAGDLSGFASHADLVAALRAMERRMFDLVATAR